MTGTRPGIQAWYNQFIGVDPSDPDHVYVGLEEVYETTDAGATWTAVGPYWNFGLPCGDGRSGQLPEDHAPGPARRRVRRQPGLGRQRRRHLQPRPGRRDAVGRTTTPGCDTLQYYYGGAGEVKGGLAYSGGLQDNGGSLLLPGRGHHGVPVRRRRRRRHREPDRRLQDRARVRGQRHVARPRTAASPTAAPTPGGRSRRRAARSRTRRTRATRTRGSSRRSRPTRRRRTTTG